MRVPHFIFVCVVCMVMRDFSSWAKEKNFLKHREKFQKVHFVDHEKRQLHLIQTWMFIYSVKQSFDFIETEDVWVRYAPKTHLDNQIQSKETCGGNTRHRLLFGDGFASDYWQEQDASGVFSIKHLW